MSSSELHPIKSTSAVPVCSQAPLGQDCCCCKRCGIGGCDVKVLDCGCCLHARCCPISDNNDPLVVCPVCFQPARALRLLPMAFDEIDAAQAEAANTELSSKRGKKRKNATIARLQPRKNTSVPSNGAPSAMVVSTATPTDDTKNGESPDLRTGRWTPEETAYCDKLIVLFEQGQLPIPDRIKLNDFLSSMLKSKQARLTKKMKNAKLSSRQYSRNLGYIADIEEAREFSQLETNFFASIRCNMERSEIRFHMQKVWRELFSSCCVAIGQKLDADAWLSSVEEMDRRSSLQKDAARMARRKIMMGYALSQDAINQQYGVFIDPTLSAADSRTAETSTDYTAKTPTASVGSSFISDHPTASLPGKLVSKKLRLNNTSTKGPSMPFVNYSSPFLARVIQYVQRHAIPFEHCDAWVPSIVPRIENGNSAAAAAAAAAPSSGDGNCRLCFAGCATADFEVSEDGGSAEPLSQDDQFDLVSFGSYSQKFSFDVGCGLPGRVYRSGIPSWERCIASAPPEQFERSGGARQWGIQTVLGVPVASPNVGRIVVLFYSRQDRPQDNVVVNRIAGELSRLMPSPQWKLVVDIGVPPVRQLDSEEASEILQLHSLIETHTPLDKNSPHVEYLPGFTSLRLLLTDHARSDRENELIKSALRAFQTYRSAGRSDKDCAWMTARDFMILSKHSGVHAQSGLHAKSGGNCAPGTCQTGSASGCAPMSAATELPSSGSLVDHNSRPQSAPATKANHHSQHSMNTSDYSTGLSPLLNSVAGGHMPQSDVLNNFAPMGLSASQLSALLQSDSSLNFHGGFHEA